MANEYATLAELKTFLSLTDTSKDTELQAKLTTGARDIDRATGRRFWLDGSATQRVFNPQGRITCSSQGVRFRVDDIGDVAGLVVEVGSAAAGWTAVTDYETWPDNALARGEPVTRLLRLNGQAWLTSSTQRLRVTAKWGWPAVPDQIKAANLLRSGRLFRRKESPEGVKGFDDLGVVRLSRYDADYDKLITPFILVGVG